MVTEGTGSSPSTGQKRGEGATAAGTQDIGCELDQCENRVQQLQTALIDATTAKHELVDALRNLGDQFNSLQAHANKQCDALLSSGDEISATERHLASIQEGIASARQDLERSQVASNKQDLARSEAADEETAAEYRDALRRMKQALKEREALAAKKEQDNAELVSRIVSLERRCAELDSRRAERESACEELREILDNRTRQVERMNKYVIRVQREIKILNEEIHSSESGIRPINGEFIESDEEIVAAVKPPEKQADSPVSPITKLWAVSRQKQDAPVEDQGEESRSGGEKEESADASLPQQYIIVPVGEDAKGTQYPLNKGELTIGRGRDHDIPVMEHGVSRVHARIVLRGFRVFIEDMGSKYGVLVNAEPKERQELKHGDKFTIGRKEFELVDLAIRAGGLRTTPAA